jgi:hypothetical protein
MSTGRRLTGSRRWLVTGAKVAVVVFLMWVWHAYLMFAMIGASLVGLRVLVTRSETASTLLGVPVDERWESINTRAWALAAQVTFLGLWVTLVAMQVVGRDCTPYLLVGVGLASAYLGGVLWYRWRQ